MATITDMLAHIETWRQARVREEYSRRIGRLPATISVSGEAEWHTPESLRDLQVALRSAEASQTLGIRHLLRFVCAEYLNHQTRTLSEDLLARQRSALIDVPILDAPVSLWEAGALIAEERRRAQREALEDATTTVIGGFNKAYRELWSRLFAVAESLGYSNLIALWEELSGVALDDFLKPLEQILRETEDTYREQMQWHLKRAFGIKLDAARRHDILVLFGLEATEPWFPRSDMIPCLEQWLREWGWDPAEHTHLHLEVRTAVAGGAWCAPVAIPAEIRLALAPTGGLRGFAQALRETGKALLLASFPAGASMALRCFPDPSLLEAHAEIFAGLVRTRRWLEIYRHVRQPGEVLRLAHLERLYIVRRYIGKALYERTLYEDSRLDGKEEAYRDALRHACGFSYPETYYLHDVEPGFTTLWQVRGWILGIHIRRQLQRQYADAWFREIDALEALRAFWAQSPYSTVEALVEKVGGLPLDVTPVVADLLSEL